jgi:hypothetical protein
MWTVIPVEMTWVETAPSQLATIIMANLADLGDLAVQVETMGIEELERFKQFGGLPDLNEAISNLSLAVMLTDEGHPNQTGYLSNLGNAQETRFDHLGDFSDLENAQRQLISQVMAIRICQCIYQIWVVLKKPASIALETCLILRMPSQIKKRQLI